MKTVFTFLCLALIVIVGATSLVLFLQNYYNSSALLTIVGIVSMAYWIKSNGILNDQEHQTAK
jgi:hypothetical protein